MAIKSNLVYYLKNFEIKVSFKKETDCYRCLINDVATRVIIQRFPAEKHNLKFWKTSVSEELFESYSAAKDFVVTSEFMAKEISKKKWAAK